MVTTRGLTIDDVKGDTDWSALEKDLLAESRLGRIALLADRYDCPADTHDPARRVRPALIRYLLEGGCEAGTRPNPKGVELLGGWIDGELDLQGCRTELDLFLLDCLFPWRPNLQDAELGGLYLTGSRAEKGLDLHRLQVETNVHLRNGFHATGLVDLAGARVTGQLDCSGGRFDGAGGPALNANAATVGAQVFLDDGFHATGEVNLRAAGITGQVDCTGGRFDGAGGRALTAEAATIGADVLLHDTFHATGPVNFIRARIEGLLQVDQATLADGLDLEAARVREGFFWRDLRGDCAGIDLTEASCGMLCDDRESWARTRKISLSGFSYDRLQSDMGIGERLAWLGRKAERDLPPEFKTNLAAQPWLRGDARSFDPQPYTQLARVLDGQGNRTGAARVLERREHLVGQAAQRRAFGRVDGTWRGGVASLPSVLRLLRDVVFRAVFGYGHAPARALLWVVAILVGAWWLYGTAYAAGQMAPNSDVVLTSGAWRAAVAAGCAPVDWAMVGWSLTAPINVDCTMPLHRWLATAPAAGDYESFNGWLYALDLFVPLDALGQERAWAPSRDRGWWGWLGYALRMPIQMAGWLITAVGAAVLTGLVGRKD